MRADWPAFSASVPVQANLSVTYPGIVRAWHRHTRGQTDSFVVVSGSAKICAYDEVTRELDEFVTSGDALKIVRIPGNYWHGFKSVGTTRVNLLYFVNKLYDKADPDEQRMPWDDKGVVPTCIDGNMNDPRVGRPWDWFRPPHK